VVSGEALFEHRRGHSSTGRARAEASTRSLSTARAVLQVLSLLLEHPEGVRADKVATKLGKSVSTAYYLLTSLCEEGFAVHECKGVYRPAQGLEALATAATHAPAAMQGGFDAVADELFRRTRKRSYVGIVRGGRIEIVAVRGRQGVRRMPGLGAEIRDSAHALAIGKVVLALLSPPALAAYISRGLKSFTANTIVTPQRLFAELAQVRRDGYAVDREEFDEDFCCIAAAIRDEQGRFIAAIGISLTAHVFDTERDELAQTVIEVAEEAASMLPARPPSGARRAPSGAPRSPLRAISALQQAS
jgi:IclR family acetate operon transcriptional repressor